MTEELWWEQIEANPRDYDLIIVFSDWLEDEGDLNAANAMRWVAANKKWPHEIGLYDTPMWFNIGGQWTSSHHHDEIPDAIFDKDDFSEVNRVTKVFAREADAFRFLISRFSRLQQAQEVQPCQSA